MGHTARHEIQSRLPPWYRGDVHAVVHFLAIGGLTAAAAVGLALAQPGLLPSIFVLVPAWGVVEYVVHRHLLHGERSWWRGLARDHGTHHAYFPADDMFAASHLDVYRILLRPQDVLAVELLVAIVAFAASFAGPGPALAVVTSANLYLRLYEIAHAAAHSEAVARHPLARGSARHHRAHHREMAGGRENFAIVFPVVDAAFGTVGADGRRRL